MWTILNKRFGKGGFIFIKDLNPIEQLFEAMKRIPKKMKTSSKTELIEKVDEIWNNF